MLWIKSFHIIFVVTWFAGLLYLPRLFVYHAMTEDAVGRERFQVMERKLFAIMTIGAGLAATFGVTLIVRNPGLMSFGWLHAKLALVAALLLYHLYCWKLIRDFGQDRNRHTHVWYRWFNEMPALALIAIIILAVVRPF